MSSPIRVLIVDGHGIVRKGISALLATAPDVEVIGEAGNGVEAVAEAQRLQPDVILMGLEMPSMDGLQAVHVIHANQPAVRILALSSLASDDEGFPAIRSGSLGYLFKDSGPDQLVKAIRQVYRGELSLHSRTAPRLLSELTPAGPVAEAISLTERETEVLHMLAQGQSNRQIAERLTIGEATVRTHVSKILAKLNLDSRTQAALYALREGLVSLEGTGGTQDKTPEIRPCQSDLAEGR